MINLAGVDDCDVTIKGELYLAGIEAIEAKGTGEVRFTITGRIGNWKLTRAWTYWIASVEHRLDGLPMKEAVILHETPNPINSKQTLGQVIRSGGDCTCPSPTGYTAQPVYGDEFDKKLLALGYKKKEFQGKEYVDINVGEIAELCNTGKLDVERYVTSYHIDDQIGLNEFTKFLNKL